MTDSDWKLVAVWLLNCVFDQLVFGCALSLVTFFGQERKWQKTIIIKRCKLRIRLRLKKILVFVF